MCFESVKNSISLANVLMDILIIFVEFQIGRYVFSVDYLKTA